MSNHIDFNENTNYRSQRAPRDSFGIARLLLRHNLVSTPQAAAQTSRLIMLVIVVISLVTTTLLLWGGGGDEIPEEAYFDPAIHNADDEPL